MPMPQIQEQIAEVVKGLLNAVHLFSSFCPFFFGGDEGERVRFACKGTSGSTGGRAHTPSFLSPSLDDRGAGKRSVLAHVDDDA